MKDVRENCVLEPDVLDCQTPYDGGTSPALRCENEENGMQLAHPFSSHTTIIP